MESKDEYINSLLLSLFLMEGEINRLNQTLDLARKGELVYINNPQIDELKAENARLKSCLQEIKEIAMGIMDDDIEESSAYSDARQIIDLITKVESEEVK